MNRAHKAVARMMGMDPLEGRLMLSADLESDTKDFLAGPGLAITFQPLQSKAECNPVAFETHGGHMLMCPPEGAAKKPREHKSPPIPPSPSDKIDPGLWTAIQVHRHPLRFPQLQYYADPQFSRFTSDGRVQVDIFSNGPSTPHEAELKAMGINIETVVDESYLRVLEGWATVKQIRELAKLPWIIRIKLPEYASPPDVPGGGPL